MSGSVLCALIKGPEQVDPFVPDLPEVFAKISLTSKKKILNVPQLKQLLMYTAVLKQCVQEGIAAVLKH